MITPPSDAELTEWLVNARAGYNTPAVMDAVERMVARIRELETALAREFAGSQSLAALTSHWSDRATAAESRLTVPAVVTAMRALQDRIDGGWSWETEALAALLVTGGDTSPEHVRQVAAQIERADTDAAERAERGR